MATRAVVTKVAVKTSTGSGNHNGFPVGALLSNGHLLGSYRNSAAHGASDGNIITKVSTDDGTSWGAEVLALDVAEDTGPSGITQLADGRVALTYNRWDRVSAAGMHPYVRYAANAAAAEAGTWGTEIEIGHAFHTYPYLASALIELPNGHQLIPISGDWDPITDEGYLYTRISRSTDGGASWSDLAACSPSTIVAGLNQNPVHYEESTIVRFPDGELLIAMRTLQKSLTDTTRYSWFGSRSTDNGVSWGAPFSLFSMTSGKAAIAVGPEGDLLALCREVVVDLTRPDNYREFWTRTLLRQSLDKGVTWETLVVVEDGSAAGNLYTSVYGSLFQLSDGGMGLIYGREYNSTTQADTMFCRLTRSPNFNAWATVRPRGVKRRSA